MGAGVETSDTCLPRYFHGGMEVPLGEVCLNGPEQGTLRCSRVEEN